MFLELGNYHTLYPPCIQRRPAKDRDATLEATLIRVTMPNSNRIPKHSGRVNAEDIHKTQNCVLFQVQAPLCLYGQSISL